VNLNQKKEKLARQTVKASQDTLAKWSSATNEYYTATDSKWCVFSCCHTRRPTDYTKRAEIQTQYEEPLKAAHQKRVALLKVIRNTLVELEVIPPLYFTKFAAIKKP
jgi:hypothetical protein